MKVRFLFVLLASTTFLAAESYPSWWNYTAPDSTALVGIQWENVAQSEFADALTGELFGEGSVGLPSLESLKHAHQILISGPDLLAIATGAFPANVLRAQVMKEHFKLAWYRGTELWISPDRGAFSLARLSDTLILTGDRKTLEAAIDRSLLESGRRYSPLLARAAKLAPGRDLWIVANELPDSLAGRFVPLDAAARNFEGAVGVEDGIALDATFQTGSESAAIGVAAQLQKSLPSLPQVARGLEVSTEGETIHLSLHASQSQLSADLRKGDQPQSDVPQSVAPHSAAPPSAAPQGGVNEAASVAPLEPTPSPAAIPAAAAPVTSTVATKATADVQTTATPPTATLTTAKPPPSNPPVERSIDRPAGPQVIRIFGLDEGVREIILPPAQ